MANFRWRHGAPSVLRAKALALGALAAALTSVTLPPLAVAQQEDAPVVFSRTIVRIYPLVMPNQPPPQPPVIELPAELRPIAYFKNPSLYIAGRLAEQEAYLIPLPQRDIHMLEQTNIFMPMDIVVINYQGIIRQIFPEFILNNLQAPIQLPPDSAGVLFLASGRAAKLGLRPQFLAQHPIFTNPPMVLR